MRREGLSRATLCDSKGLMARVLGGLRREEGATLVETALSITLLIIVFFTIIQGCFVLYAYNAVAEAAREASRYAAVRGSTSCQVLSTFPNCNLGPTSAGNPLQTYVQGLGFPLSNSMTVSASWASPSVDNKGSTTWPTACTTLQDANLNYCNQQGNQVTVVVNVSVPVFFVTSSITTFNPSSTSSMVIVE